MCIEVELEGRSPDDTRCLWNIELKELWESRGREDGGSSSPARNKHWRYVERKEAREVSVLKVAL